MNIAVIFAGGAGTRMRSKDIPKQFLNVHGKPIIVHTLEIFQNHPEIDGIIVSIIPEGLDYMNELKEKYHLTKIGKIVKGGETGQLSIYNGLKAASKIYGTDENIVLIHDGVRPLIDDKIISENIASVKKYGSAITCAPAKEGSVIIDEDSNIKTVIPRAESRTAKAPQSFYLKDILNADEDSIKSGIVNEIDSCSLMDHHGFKLHIVEGDYGNIKVTTPEDFFMLRGIYDQKENSQLLNPDE